MECCFGVGAPKFAAMAASPSIVYCPLRRERVKQSVKTQPCCIWRVDHRRIVGSSSSNVRSSTSDSSCVAVRERFADEEDFIKAGGSELLYVQMQQNKHMDDQSKMADKVLSLLFVLLVKFAAGAMQCRSYFCIVLFCFVFVISQFMPYYVVGGSNIWNFGCTNVERLGSSIKFWVEKA